MAYQFFAGKMASATLDSKLAGAIVQLNGANIAAYEGSFLTLGNLAADTTYSAGGLEYDTYYATAPAALTDEVVVLDPAIIESLTDADGNVYRLGVKQYNKQLPAGQVGRVRRFELHDKFWLGNSCFASAPTVGQYATLTAGAMTLTPAAAAGTDFAVRIWLSKDLTAGMSTVGTSYYCEVVGL